MMKAVSFGEIMLRFSPEGNQRLVQSEKLNVTFGGAEANVAVALAQWGIHSIYVTKLPVHEIGQAAVNSLRKYGVDTSRIVRGGNRIGAYYCEKGASQRPSKVIYDRAGSAFALAGPDEFDFAGLFDKDSWLHMTGITPALGENALNCAVKIMSAARDAGTAVSFDINYRSKLWTKQQAGETLKKLLPYATVLIANENQVAEIIGIKAPFPPSVNDEYKPEANEYMARSLMEKYGFDTVALTARRTLSAEVNTFRAMVANKNEVAFSRDYKINIVDRVGSGDAFAAGIIRSLIKKKTTVETVEFATAASVLAHSVEGDYALISEEETESIVNFGSAKVQR